MKEEVGVSGMCSISAAFVNGMSPVDHLIGRLITDDQAALIQIAARTNCRIAHDRFRLQYRALNMGRQ
jgi:hypothetical protein